MVMKNLKIQYKISKYIIPLDIDNESIWFLIELETSSSSDNSALNIAGTNTELVDRLLLLNCK